MIERNRDADFILISEFLEIAIVLPIIQNVEMTQSSSFRVAGSPRGKLNISSIFKINLFLSFDQFTRVIIRINRVKIIEVEHPLHLVLSNQDDILEVRKILHISKVKWVACLFDLRHDVLEDLDVVRALESFSHDKGLYPYFLQAVL